MFNTKHYTINIKLPQPHSHHCGGTMFPIFQPCSLVKHTDSFGMASPEPIAVVREGFNEVIWKCDRCGQELRGN